MNTNQTVLQYDCKEQINVPGNINKCNEKIYFRRGVPTTIISTCI